MLYTLTTNPAVDLNICTDRLTPRKVNRTFNTVYTPNGKGLNVSFVLEHFGIASKIMGFFGGFTGTYITEETQQRGYTIHPVWTEEITRINIFLNDGITEYKLVNEGPCIAREKQQEMLEKIRLAEDMECLVISGSLPQGIELTFYDEIFEIAAFRSIDVILDISSEYLETLLHYRPLLIKPNDEEVEKIFGYATASEEQIVIALERIHERGAQNILMTMGERGAYFYNGKNIWYSSVQPVKLLSSACAGDAALAGFLSIWLQEPANIETAMKRSAAVGANVAESNALGTFDRVEEYVKNIEIRRVK